MASAYATKLAEGFSAKVMKEVYATALFEQFVNRDYEGDITQVGSKLNILSLAKLTEKTYSGSNLSVDDLNESNAVLTIDQKKSFYWREKTIDKWASYIKEPRPVVVEQTGSERKKNVDTFVLGFWADVAAGQRVGTDYVTGTVTVTTVTGAVVGSGTTFTSGMVGKPFKATGHSVWYRVATFTDTTHITIEDDLDDVSSQYTGGTIAGGTAYTIQANTAVAVTGSNLMAKIGALKLQLDNAEIPEENRVLVLHPTIAQYIPTGANIAISVPAVYEELVKRGYITELLGFKVFQSTRVVGDNTNGYHCLAINRNFLTFADKVLEVGMEEDLIGNFGSAYKDLYVYGAKVTDNRRKFAAELLATG
jgi:hypothetical protein